MPDQHAHQHLNLHTVEYADLHLHGAAYIDLHADAHKYSDLHRYPDSHVDTNTDTDQHHYLWDTDEHHNKNIHLNSGSNAGGDVHRVSQSREWNDGQHPAPGLLGAFNGKSANLHHCLPKGSGNKLSLYGLGGHYHSIGGLLESTAGGRHLLPSGTNQQEQVGRKTINLKVKSNRPFSLQWTPGF